MALKKAVLLTPMQCVVSMLTVNVNECVGAYILHVRTHCSHVFGGVGLLVQSGYYGHM